MLSNIAFTQNLSFPVLVPSTLNISSGVSLSDTLVGSEVDIMVPVVTNTDIKIGFTDNRASSSWSSGDLFASFTLHKINFKAVASKFATIIPGIIGDMTIDLSDKSQAELIEAALAGRIQTGGSTAAVHADVDEFEDEYANDTSVKVGLNKSRGLSTAVREFLSISKIAPVIETFMLKLDPPTGTYAINTIFTLNKPPAPRFKVGDGYIVVFNIVDNTSKVFQTGTILIPYNAPTIRTSNNSFTLPKTIQSRNFSVPENEQERNSNRNNQAKQVPRLNLFGGGKL